MVTVVNLSRNIASVKHLRAFSLRSAVFSKNGIHVNVVTEMLQIVHSVRSFLKTREREKKLLVLTSFLAMHICAFPVFSTLPDSFPAQESQLSRSWWNVELRHINTALISL